MLMNTPVAYTYWTLGKIGWVFSFVAKRMEFRLISRPWTTETTEKKKTAHEGEEEEVKEEESVLLQEDPWFFDFRHYYTFFFILLLHPYTLLYILILHSYTFLYILTHPSLRRVGIRLSPIVVSSTEHIYFIVVIFLGHLADPLYHGVQCHWFPFALRLKVKHFSFLSSDFFSGVFIYFFLLLFCFFSGHIALMEG